MIDVAEYEWREPGLWNLYGQIHCSCHTACMEVVEFALHFHLTISSV